MSDHILTVNAGSSSLKFALFTAGTLECLAIGQIEGIGTHPHLVLKGCAGEKIISAELTGERQVDDHSDALRTILTVLGSRYSQARVAAVGHRVVHGGLDFVAPVVVTDDQMQRLRALTPLAPLHQPHNLSGIAAAKA